MLKYYKAQMILLWERLKMTTGMICADGNNIKFII